MSVKKFGLPYTGSKSRIAPWLIEMFPDCDNFVDVFAGGCAVSHAMILYGKAKKITINDIKGDVPALFLDALHGELKKYDPYKWIDRETFFEQKDSNPFIRLVFSFGNNERDYLYSHQIEDYKRAVHLAIVDDNWNSFSVLCPELWENCYLELLNYPIDNKNYSNSINLRRLIFQKKCSELLREISGNNWFSDIIQQNPYYRTARKEWISHGKTGSKIVGGIGNEVIERAERIRLLDSTISTNFPSISATSMDYRLLDIPNNSLVFCDPPYRRSKVKYNDMNFEHEEFYDWCLEKAKHNIVFVTEYEINHSHFHLVGEKARQVSMNGVGSKGLKVERVYEVIP